MVLWDENQNSRNFQIRQIWLSMTHPQGLATTSLETPNIDSVAGLALINLMLIYLILDQVQPDAMNK